MVRRRPTRGSVGNKAYQRALLHLNRELRNDNYKERFSLAEVAKIFKEWVSRCAMCGVALNVRAVTGTNALFFQFYTPLKYGGKPVMENLMPVCATHRHTYRPGRRMREEIPDIDTFADYIEQLVRTIILSLNWEKENSPNLSAGLEKIRRIKRLINFQLEDITINLRYQPFKDWEPSSYEILTEGNNTLPDLVEKLAKTCANEEDMLTSPDDVKEKITNSIKQVVTTKQYKIVREKKK